MYAATLSRDVDDDGREDILQLERSTGSASSITLAKLTLSRDGRVVETSTTTSFYTFINRQSPDDIQNRGNRTTVPPPRERHPFRSHPMA